MVPTSQALPDKSKAAPTPVFQGNDFFYQHSLFHFMMK